MSLWWIIDLLCFTRAIITPLQEDSKLVGYNYQFIATFISPAIYKKQPMDQTKPEN